MSRQSRTEPSAVNAIRTALGIGGAIAIVMGLLILIWPERTALVLTVMIGIYAIGGGLVYAGLGIFSREKSGWSRVGHIVLGVLYVLAGISMLTAPGFATAWLALFIGILVGVMWIAEGIVALSTLSFAVSRGWTIFFAILSIIAGIGLFVMPILGALVMWWFVGIALLALGLAQVVRAFTFGTVREETTKSAR